MENKSTRPSVLDSASSTQMDELERATGGGDKEYFSQLTQSYGWDQSIGEKVWHFMTHRVTRNEVDKAFEEGKGKS
jgi:ABC-type microcin C transport system permease subunit YejB